MAKKADWTGQQLTAEFIATTLFVWAGTGAVVAANRWTRGGGISDAGALVGISMGFGFTISVLAYAIGSISGGHMNPAVTFAFMLLRMQSIVSGLLYMLAQFAGGFLGPLLLWGCTASLTDHCLNTVIYEEEIDGGKETQSRRGQEETDLDKVLFNTTNITLLGLPEPEPVPDQPEPEPEPEKPVLDEPEPDLAFGLGELTGAPLTDPALDKSGVCASSMTAGSTYEGGITYGPAFGLGANTVGPRVSQGSAFLIEMIGTYLLVYTVLHTAVYSKSKAGNAAPIAIGWAVTVCHLVLVPFTGCGINPARSLGPMIVDSIGGLAQKVWIRGAWVYYVAPWFGSALATGTYMILLKKDDIDAAKKKDDDLEKAKNIDEPRSLDEEPEAPKSDSTDKEVEATKDVDEIVS